MKAIDPRVTWLDELIISNVWLFRPNAQDVVLIDTGHALERSALLAALSRAGIRNPGDLTAVLLTHRHSDHAGNAAALRQRFGCKVICHSLDKPLLEGSRQPPSMWNRTQPLAHQAMCWMEDHFPARCTVDETYRDGPWDFGLTVIPVHGHTEGSVMLLHEESGTLFSGDAMIVGIPPLRRPRRAIPAVPYYAQNLHLCDTQLLRFLESEPRLHRLCSGHGPSLSNTLPEELENVKRRLRARLDEKGSQAFE